MKKVYDVIIAGAGPAGSSCAYRLATAGLEVLLLEKKKLPREKLCAGGVPASVFDVLNLQDFKKESISIKNYRFTYEGKNESTGKLPDGSIYSIDRRLFDCAIAEKATGAGALLKESSRVIEAEEIKDRVVVRTADGREHAGRYLVGAYGGHSGISRNFDFFYDIKNNYATCGYFEFRDGYSTIEKYAGTVHLDFNFYQGGVAGILPKKDHLWIGVYVAKKIPLKNIEKALMDFIIKLNLKGKTGTFKGLFIPLYTGKQELAKGRVILAGEAARLVNPLSGEGIKPAVDSGLIAADEIIKACKNNFKTAEMQDYSERIHDEIGRELYMARRFLQIAYLFPKITYEGMIRVSEDAVKIMNGTLSYGNFFERLKRKIARKTGLSRYL